ncbi:MAG TPA: hypothetical protein VM187_04620 [Niastella sp.]|nr:hypothetical protein [Niastella sp.]
MLLQIPLHLHLMTGNRIITKLTTLVLILVFSQKMGMSLYLHNWLHTSNQQHTTSPSKPISGQEIQFACGCINDFNLPFTETAVPELQKPVIVVHKPNTERVYWFLTVSKYFRSLRAPPVS